MTCPHCGNDDGKMIEWTRRIDKLFKRVMWCCVCSREFSID